MDSKGDGGFKTPLGTGQCLIIVHAGSSDGFVQEVKLSVATLWQKNNTGDYRNEMNAHHFEE